MDRNSIIGFSLLAVLLIGYIVYNNNEQKKLEEVNRKQFVIDSIANARAHPPMAAKAADTSISAATAALSDSARKAMPAALYGTAQTLKVENKKLALTFSTKGAYPTSAEIKGFKTYDQKPLYLFSGAANQLKTEIPVGNTIKSTADLYFTPTQKTEPNGDQTIDFMADLGNGQKVDMVYTILADDYMMRCNVRLTGVTAKTLTWQTQSLHTEHDVLNERQNSQVYFRFKNNDHDYFTIRQDKTETLTHELNWVGYRSHYFNTTMVADNGFTAAKIEATSTFTNDTVSQNKVVFDLPSSNGAEQSVNLRWYIGPNKYQTLKSYQMGLEDMVPLGTGIFAFTKYVNKWVILPVFDFLSSFITNYGLIIILLTIFIRLILSFFTYKSYLSAAKMRVLKPEIDELRAKHGDDQQKFGVEQMKLYRTAGVNPLGGCLPTLFQLPILVAMYSFFPSSIELRQKHFLWATDLSTYDSIFSWTTDIPVLSSVYGNHISLFTLLMTASSLFLALYNRNMTAQDPNNPMMKYMPYIFPIILMGVFNKMAAALTFYYFFSNMISILQQFIIQKFIINEDKIHAQIKENRNKPATPSKWQAKIEEMQKTQIDKQKQKPITKK